MALNGIASRYFMNLMVGAVLTKDRKLLVHLGYIETAVNFALVVLLLGVLNFVLHVAFDLALGVFIVMLFVISTLVPRAIYKAASRRGNPSLWRAYQIGSAVVSMITVIYLLCVFSVQLRQ